LNELILSRKELEEQEQKELASFAARAIDSKGRVFPQEEHPLRTAYQRDRDRIIHSAAFRRMEYKTQVFIPHEKDHYRTRLTHTIEVAQIARTIARNLRLNRDLTEAVALVHDVGHTPFGHSGEEILDRLLKDFGGFNHNHQSLRVVDKLEQRYPNHPGLNLSYEVREGIVKHETSIKMKIPEFKPEEQATLEANLVDIADEIAYNSHDIDDGLSSGIITFDDLRETGFYKDLNLKQFVEKNNLDENRPYPRYALVRRLVDCMTTDVLEETSRRLKVFNITSLAEVRACPEKICGYSENMQTVVDEIKDFLKLRLYKTKHLVSLAQWAEKIIEFLFYRFIKEPGLMPGHYLEMINSEKAEIVIKDYIAGMTDRYATETYTRLHK